MIDETITREIVLVINVTIIFISYLLKGKIKESILTIDGFFSILGLGLGLLITFLNLKYSNIYLISLGPIIAISSLVYIQYRNKILVYNIYNIDSYFDISPIMLSLINIFYWITICVSLLEYYWFSDYQRSMWFFLFISVNITLLSLEILACNKFNNIYYLVTKVILSSIILKASAYFISPYYIGSDPWAHAEYIRYFLHFQHLEVPSGFSQYYIFYPIMHIFTCAINLIAAINIKESMFFVGILPVLSTIFVYLIIKNITNNINISLLSMLLLNFADFYIQWSVQVIAMTFGLAVYSFIIYLIYINKKQMQIVNKIILMSLIFIIIWTHTISAFISLLTFINIYISIILYKYIYKIYRYNDFVVSRSICILFIVLLFIHWADPTYPFFDMIVFGLIQSLSKEAEFLGREPVYSEQTWDAIFTILGFNIYILFGIIGYLYCISKEYSNEKLFSMSFLDSILYFIFFIFPVFGVRNIIPYRWPAYIYITFILFVSVGLTTVAKLLKKYRVIFIANILFIIFFFMITTNVANTDSPIYAKETNQRLMWTESEINLFKQISNLFDGVIVADQKTCSRPFNTYLNRESISYPLLDNNSIDWCTMKDKLIIWRKVSIDRPIEFSKQTGDKIEFVAGIEFKKNLEMKFSCIYNVESAKAFLGSLTDHTGSV